MGLDRPQGLARSLRTCLRQSANAVDKELGAIPHLPLWVLEDGMGKEMSADMIDDYIAAVGSALGLPIEDAWMGAVRANLEVSLRMARLVDDFPLPDEAEPASVFTA
jgi:hypothetical protein